MCNWMVHVLGSHNVCVKYYIYYLMHTPPHPTGVNCVADIDECASPQTNNCHGDRAECVNTMGGHFCRCRSGFTGNGTYCEG